MIDGILGVVFAALGLAVIAYLCGLLWQALEEPLAGAFDRRRLAGCEALAARGDAALRDGRTDEALRLFVAAVQVAPVKSAAIAAAIERHHLGLLNRLIAASDLKHGENIGSLSLALADRALRQRKLLQSSYVAALQTGNRKRRREIEAELRANGKDMHRAMADLATEVLSRDPRTQVH